MKNAYVDSSVWITFVEGLPIYQDIVEEQLQSFMRDNWQFCISDALLLEVLAKPLLNNRIDLIDSYNQIFHQLLHLETFTEIFQHSLLIAEKDRLTGMDAVHVAFATAYQCELFVTTDLHYRNLKSLPLHWIDLRHANSS